MHIYLDSTDEGMRPLLFAQNLNAPVRARQALPIFFVRIVRFDCSFPSSPSPSVSSMSRLSINMLLSTLPVLLLVRTALADPSQEVRFSFLFSHFLICDPLMPFNPTAMHLFMYLIERCDIAMSRDKQYTMRY